MKGAKETLSGENRLRECGFVLFPAFDVDQMISKLGFNGPMDLADRLKKNHLIELGHHLAAKKSPEVPALFSGRTKRMLFRKGPKACAFINFSFEIPAFFFVLYKYVACLGFGHNESLYFKKLFVLGYCFRSS
ncbi:MAG: hypothetical protein A2Z83_03840 [Omnitrophica bacterium GWA2_52_8]|nr:MAG: hypothetical protein A2Z83_03840 [Omnitrophica bacterium GWA2_52_8]